MTPEQRKMIDALLCCTFLPGSFDKRFIRSLDWQEEDYKLSDKQAVYLRRVFIRYRRQHGVVEESSS